MLGSPAFSDTRVWHPPPFTITPEQISVIGQTMRQALDEVLVQREAATAPAR